jgi:hypothetical protein
MTFPSSSGIKPRLRALFTSRFDVVEAGQSPGAPLVATAEVSATAFIAASAAALETVLLEQALVAAAELFFFTILGCLGGGGDWNAMVATAKEFWKSKNRGGRKQ